MYKDKKMDIKVSYDQKILQKNANAQIEYRTDNFYRVETLFSLEKLDEAMEFFRCVDKHLKKIFNNHTEEKIYADSYISVGNRNISVTVERKIYE